jgi:hypothetical protein
VSIDVDILLDDGAICRVLSVTMGHSSMRPDAYPVQPVLAAVSSVFQAIEALYKTA